jgi:tetratricopeptide (TPR) repeat protein
VPPTIQALLAARLDRLGAEERAAAERAAVVGRVFEQPAVVALSPAESRDDIPGNLSSLVRKELIRADRSGLTPWETFRFRHMLIRDAAYERLPKSERAALHELFADWLDRTLGDRRTEAEEIIGYHLEQAYRYRAELAPVDERTRDLASRAALRLIAAGGRALERSDIAAVVNLYGRAAALLDPDDPARVSLLPDLGRALNLAGRFDEATATISEALERADAAGDELAIAWARVVRHIVLPSPELSPNDLRRIADECSATFERAGDERGLSMAWRLRGQASWDEGSAAGEEVALASALVHARRAGSHWEEVSIVHAVSIDLYWGPTPVAAGIRWCDDTLAQAPDDRGIEVGVVHALAHLHARLGNFELARAFAARSIEISAESGLRSDAIVLTEVVADVETLAGNHDAAEQALGEACNSFIAMGRTQYILEALHALAQVDAGRPVDVERLAAFVPGRAADTTALLNFALGAAHFAAGRLDEAERDVRSAVEYYETTDFINFHANSALRLGDIVRAAGRPAEARDSFEHALDLYRQKGNLVGMGIAEARLTG